MLGKRLIKAKVADGGGGCTDIVDNYDPFGGSGVALYQLNGDATDSSPNAYNGTWSGTEAYTTGVFGQSGVFNGSSYIQASSNTIFDWGTKSLSLWVNINSFTTIPAGIISKLDNIAPFGWWLDKDNDNKIRFVYYDLSNNFVTLKWNTLPTLNTWYHVCITGDGTTDKMYINGIFVDSVSSITPVTNSDPITIGRFYSNIDNNYFDGKIDQIRFFDEALTPLEVEALYTEELCICDGTVDTLDILGDGSCIATYQLDGNANDLSGNYSGTPIGTISYGVGEFDLGAATTDLDSSNYIDLNIQLALPQSSDLWSVSTWFKAETGSNTLFNIIGSNATITDAFNFAIQYNESTDKIIVPNWNFGGSPITPSYTSNATITDGWNHISLVKTGVNSFSLYINDNFDGSFTTNSSGAFTSNSNLALGIYYLGLGGGASSYNDQVRIFNKALSSSEVTTLYNETACTKAACSGTTNTLDILGDSSCIAAYPLDGSPLDLSGNYNGVQTNVTYPVGNFDLAGSFNGSSSYISTSYIVPASTPASISSWFNTSSTGNYRTLFSDAPSNGAAVNTRMQIYFTPTNTFDVIIGNNSGYWIGSSNSIASYIDGNWHNLIATYNGTDVKVYIDGSLFQSFTSTISFGTAGNQSLVLGKAGLNNVNYWNGSIDQVRIFNKALSAGEVTTLYNETACN